MAKGPIDWSHLLVRGGIVSLDDMEDARKQARGAGQTVEMMLVRLGHCDDVDIMKAKAKQYGMEFVNLEELEIAPETISLVRESTARSKKVLPLELRDGALRVAVSNPLDFELLEELRFVQNRKIDPVLATEEAIDRAIKKYYNVRESQTIDGVIQEFTESQIDTPLDELSRDEAVDENSAPIVKLVHLMITEAIKMRASDIHVEPFAERIRVRYRIDGVLIERDNTPKRLLSAVLSRIKILSRLDIAERRRPQDGRIKVTVGSKQLDLRVSVIPTSHGQSVVMRILDKDNIKIGLRQLGFGEEDYRVFSNLIRRPNGIILVTGPTGSGKTTTLYAALNELNKPDRKIITAEDPVEYYLPGVNQVEVRHDIGLDFARIIRAMLRQAPNVILVGEIRDRETAEMAIQASLTGHLVFSTLHTNDAPSSITRLIDIGVPPYLVSSSVIAIMAQRLVRVVCSQCKVPYMPSEAMLEIAQIPLDVARRAHFMKGEGCGKCGKSGYRGRQAIFEMMPITSKIRELTFKGANSQDVRKAAVSAGMRTLYKDGIIKSLRGTTTIDEVIRIAGKKV